MTIHDDARIRTQVRWLRTLDPRVYGDIANDIDALLAERGELRELLTEAERRAIFPGGAELRSRIRNRLAASTSDTERPRKMMTGIWPKKAGEDTVALSDTEPEARP